MKEVNCDILLLAGLTARPVNAPVLSYYVEPAIDPDRHVFGAGVDQFPRIVGLTVDFL